MWTSPKLTPVKAYTQSLKYKGLIDNDEQKKMNKNKNKKKDVDRKEKILTFQRKIQNPLKRKTHIVTLRKQEE